MKTNVFTELFGKEECTGSVKVPMSQLAEDDVPYSKLLLKGTGSLSDAELLSIIVSNAKVDEYSLEIARTVLAACDNNLSNLWKLSVNDLQGIIAMTHLRAVRIVSMIALGNRRNEAISMSKEKIGNSREAFEIFRNTFGDKPYEEFWMLILNKANRVIRKLKISEGGISGTVVDPKKIFKMALDEHASSIILSHNHPSGNIQPSDADVKLTEKIRNSGKLLDIAVLDHIILGGDQYFSFADDGRM